MQRKSSSKCTVCGGNHNIQACPAVAAAKTALAQCNVAAAVAPCAPDDERTIDASIPASSSDITSSTETDATLIAPTCDVPPDEANDTVNAANVGLVSSYLRDTFSAFAIEASHHVIYAPAEVLSVVATENDWLVDSGCSRHMSYSRELFHSLQRLSVPVTITVANGSTVHCECVGDVTITLAPMLDQPSAQLKLKNVLYVPHLRRNLFSVPTAARVEHVTTIFKANDKGCTLWADDGQLLGAGLYRRVCQLPFLELASRLSTVHAASAGAAVAKAPNTIGNHLHPNSLERAHLLFGHLNYRRALELSVTAPSLGVKIATADVSKARMCEACVFAKSSRKPVDKYASRPSPTAVGDIIHSDTIPVSILSQGGHSGYVLFKDGYSEYFSVILQKGKLNLDEHVRAYFDAFRARFKRVPELLRTDGEYRSDAIRELCASLSIRQEFSAPYRQAQNDAIERPHQTIMQSALAMMFYCGAPPSYWPYAVMCAVYMINRLPTPRMPPSESPYFRWWHTHPESKHWHVFGCVVYAHVDSSLRHRFSHRARKGVFLGYSEQHNGYIVQLLDTMAVVIRYDVTFDERTLYKHLKLPMPAQRPSSRAAQENKETFDVGILLSSPSTEGSSSSTEGSTIVQLPSPQEEPELPDRCPVNELRSGSHYGPEWTDAHISLCTVCKQGGHAHSL